MTEEVQLVGVFEVDLNDDHSPLSEDRDPHIVTKYVYYKPDSAFDHDWSYFYEDTADEYNVVAPDADVERKWLNWKESIDSIFETINTIVDTLESPLSQIEDGHETIRCPICGFWGDYKHGFVCDGCDIKITREFHWSEPRQIHVWTSDNEELATLRVAEAIGLGLNHQDGDKYLMDLTRMKTELLRFCVNFKLVLQNSNAELNESTTDAGCTVKFTNGGHGVQDILEHYEERNP